MEEELRLRWSADVGRGAASWGAFERLCSRYREPHRHYHGLVHVLRVLRTVDELQAATAASVPSDRGSPEAVATRLAAWYHDAVYDPQASDNEAASARLAIAELTGLGRPADEAALIAELVLATAHLGDALEPPSPTIRSPDADRRLAHRRQARDVLVDADLAVLAGEASDYQAYADGIRAEYAHLDQRAWRDGRARVLRTLLARRPLFATAAMHDCEPRARANLTAELARWTDPTSG